MKNGYLLPLFLVFATALFAQQKTEFGFLVKAGNFTVPQTGPGPQPVGFTHSINTLSAGFSTGLGIYEKIELKPQWGLKAELLYTVSLFRLHETFNYDPQYEQYMLFESDWTRRYTEQSLMLPLKLYFNMETSAKTVLEFGVSPSFNLRTNQHVTSGFTNEFARSPYFRSKEAKSAPRTQLLFVTSLQRRICLRTRIGIELMIAPRSNDLNIYFADNQDKTSSARSPFSVKSLSISLYHSMF